MKLIRVFTVFAFLWMISIPSIFAEGEVKVVVKNEQGEEARPDLDTAKVELMFTGIQNGSAHIYLSSPERKFFSPTDFPMVEGTPLIDSTLTVEKGRATFDYMFPIRGDYQMKVEVMDENGNLTAKHQLVVNIPENPDELKNGMIFIASLALFGCISGYILAKRRKNVYAV